MANQDYYHSHADEYFTQTASLNMEHLYREFLKHIPGGGAILDAGCGSGRDAKYFSEQGYRVTAFDASSALAVLASAHLGFAVSVFEFQEMDQALEYDGIWACASLLHVPLGELADIFCRLSRALNPGGVLYASFKYGSGETDRNERRFTDMDESGLNQLMSYGVGFNIMKEWVSVDIRSDRNKEKWLNMILQKEAH